MRIENEPKLDFDDVLIRPKRSTLGSRKAVQLHRTYKFHHSQRVYNGIPIIAANMDTIGTFEMAVALSNDDLMTALHKHYPVGKLVTYFTTTQEPTFYSMGILQSDIDKLYTVHLQSPINYLCIDVANGYTEFFVDQIKKIRENYPTTTIMAGNVVTGEMVEELILSGVDIVKVGIGPGSVCTTRKMTGVGYPQLSAIIECMDAAHGLGGLICADGGCRTPGDVAKAFAAGADFVMLGGMLAGHNECGGEVILDDNKVLGVKFYGMSSETAMDKYAGGVAGYRAAEGKEVIVPHRGPVAGTVQEILGGLRSACTYTGARTLKDLSKCTTFVRVNSGRQLNTVFGE